MALYRRPFELGFDPRLLIRSSHDVRTRDGLIYTITDIKRSPVDLGTSSHRTEFLRLFLPVLVVTCSSSPPSCPSPTSSHPPDPFACTTPSLHQVLRAQMRSTEICRLFSFSTGSILDSRFTNVCIFSTHIDHGIVSKLLRRCPVFYSPIQRHETQEIQPCRD